MPRMVMSAFWDFQVPLPPLPEQRRIAAILDQADALRAKRREALAQLDSLAQSIFIDMFGDPVTNSKGWPLQSISELPIQIADGNYSSKYPSASEFVTDGIPFIRANNLNNLTVSIHDMRFISPEKHKELAKGHLRTNDVLLVTRGEIGKVGIVPPEFEDANINAQLVLLRPKNKSIQSSFLCHLFDDPRMNAYVRSFETGVALKQLPIHSLKRILLPLPPVALQTQFSVITEQLQKSRKTLSMSSSALDALFTSLQHRAFQGEL